MARKSKGYKTVKAPGKDNDGAVIVNNGMMNEVWVHPMDYITFLETSTEREIHLTANKAETLKICIGKATKIVIEREV